MRCGQGFALPSREPEGKTVQGHLVRPVMAARVAEKSRNLAENSALAARLSREITGDVFFDAFNRGRYATDASFYQIMPAGVVVPRNMDEALTALAICRDERLWLIPQHDKTGVRDLSGLSPPDRMRKLFSIKFVSNPRYWSTFVVLCFPVRYWIPALMRVAVWTVGVIIGRRSETSDLNEQSD